MPLPRDYAIVLDLCAYFTCLIARFVEFAPETHRLEEAFADLAALETTDASMLLQARDGALSALISLVKSQAFAIASTHWEAAAPMDAM